MSARSKPTRSDALAVGLLFVSVLYFVAVFSAAPILREERFYSSAYDAGLFDQGVWLLAHGEPPVSTIKGVNIFGDHASLHSLFIVPFMRLFDSIHVLYVWQAALLALAAVPLFALARSVLGSPAAALAVSTAYLLHPALQNMALENFHPETSVPFFLSMTLWFLHKRQWPFFLLFCLLSSMGKEDVGISVFVLGLYVAFVLRERRYGFAASTIGILWYLAASQVLMPWALGSDAQAQPVIFSAWFSTVPAKLLQPWKLFALVMEDSALLYYCKLLLPVALLCMAAPAAFAVALPPMLINAMSESDYLRTITYHYNYVTLPFVFGAVVMGMARLQKAIPATDGARYARAAPALALLFMALSCNLMWSHWPLHRHAANLHERYTGVQHARVAVQNEVVALIPPEASVSAAHRQVNQLTHRRDIYMFPNPFRLHLWNMWFRAEKYPLMAGADIEYVLLDFAPEHTEERMALMRYLLSSSRYERIYDASKLVLLKRIQETDPARGLDYIVRSGGTERRGRVPTLFFPASAHYFRELFGEVLAEGPFTAEFSGLIDIPDAGTYSVRIASNAIGRIAIDGHVHTFDGSGDSAPFVLAQGKLSLRLHIESSLRPYKLRVSLVTPEEEEIQIDESQLYPAGGPLAGSPRENSAT